MRNATIIALFILLGCSLAFTGKAYTPTRFYDSTGEITNTYVSDLKVWLGTVVPTTGNGYVIDISSAGFSQIKTVTVLPMKNTANANDMPDVSVKSITNTALTVNIKNGNGAVVSILGINVLSGSPMVFSSDVSGISLYVRVTGK